MPASVTAPPAIDTPASGLEVWRVRVDRSPDAFDASSRFLDEDELRRAARFRHDADRMRHVQARASLRQLLAQRLGWPHERLAFGTNAFGKPALVTPDTGLHFNSSHSGEWILHALDARAPVGMDVEEIRPEFANTEDFAIAFSREEAREISSLPPGDRARALARAWVRKEAYVKAIGEGVIRSPADICIVADERGVPRRLYDRNATRTALDWSFEDIPVDANHVACLVYRAVNGGHGLRRRPAVKDFEGSLRVS